MDITFVISPRLSQHTKYFIFIQMTLAYTDTHLLLLINLSISISIFNSSSIYIYQERKQQVKIKMKRRREMEKKRSEMSSVIEELSNFTVLLPKPHQDDLIATVSQQNDDKKDEENSITVSNATHIPIKPFLSICNFLLQVLDKIGPTMVVLRRDVQNNIQRLEKLYETDPALYSNVVEIFKKEAKENCARKNGSCSKAFLWLTRSLDFGVSLFKAIVKDDCGLNMEKAVEESYNATLKQWHGWISSAAYRVALKLVPDNKTLITILTAQDEENETLKEEIQTLVSLLTPVLEDIHSILIQYELDKMKSA